MYRSDCPSCGDSRNGYENHYCRTKAQKKRDAAVEKALKKEQQRALKAEAKQLRIKGGGR